MFKKEYFVHAETGHLKYPCAGCFEIHRVKLLHVEGPGTAVLRSLCACTTSLYYHCLPTFIADSCQVLVCQPLAMHIEPFQQHCEHDSGVICWTCDLPQVTWLVECSCSGLSWGTHVQWESDILGGRVGRAVFGARLCSQENILWWSMDEPEFRVLLRISSFDLLLLFGKEDLDGISFRWGFCLSEGCRTGPTASDCAVSFLLTPWQWLSPPSWVLWTPE